MNLYDLNQMYTEALEGAIDENGEIKSDALADLLGEIKEERETKILNIACWIKNLEAEAEAIKLEEKRLATRRQQATNKAESLEKYLKSNLGNGEKIKDARVEITWRKSSSVEIVSDLDTFVGAYPNLCKVKYEPSKTAIKEAIESGELVIGAEIVEKKNLVIK